MTDLEWLARRIRLGRERYAARKPVYRRLGYWLPYTTFLNGWETVNRFEFCRGLMVAGILMNGDFADATNSG